MADTGHELSDLRALDELGRGLASAYAAAASTAAMRATPPRSRFGRRPRRWAIAIAVVALVALTVPVYVLHFDNRQVEVGSVSTARAVERVARAAALHPLPFARANQFIYTKTTAATTQTIELHVAGDPSHSGSFTYTQTGARRAWVGARGGVMRNSTGANHYPAPAEQELGDYFFAHAVGRPRPSVTTGLIGGGSNSKYTYLGTERLTRRQLLDYPREPEAIYRRMRSSVLRTLRPPHSAGYVNSMVVGEMTGVWVGFTPVPPDLRAAMVQALGVVPGVKSIGLTRDSRGRVGAGFDISNAGSSFQLVFDPATGLLLQQTATGPGILSMVAPGVLGRPKPHSALRWKVVGDNTTVVTYDAQRVVDRLPRSLARNFSPAIIRGHGTR